MGIRGGKTHTHTYLKIKNTEHPVRSRISSKRIFASCVRYFDDCTLRMVFHLLLPLLLLGLLAPSLCRATLFLSCAPLLRLPVRIIRPSRPSSSSLSTLTIDPIAVTGINTFHFQGANLATIIAVAITCSAQSSNHRILKITSKPRYCITGDHS